MKMQLPTKKDEPNVNPECDFNQLVVIGANGAGKTRFGAEIESRYHEKAHRISAQKSLSMPNSVGTKSKEHAEGEFLYGQWNDQWNEQNKDFYRITGWLQGRWGGDLNTHLLNDYEKLMVLLHTEEYEQSLQYKEYGGDKPKTKLDRIQKIFENILPHRKLRKKVGVIEVYPVGMEANTYNASQMSDGERVVFYLIGEIVCAPLDSIIIIDEPEMHIHRSLVKRLFDLIEIERPDCAFVYLTHDIDFAFTRQNALKIWAKSYEGGCIWDYEILERESPIPEQLYLEVLGSRKPILFIEGDNSSIDYELYEQVYSDYTVKPLGSCEKVIQTVKSFNEEKNFHNIHAFGIVDRDRRQDGDLVKLNEKKIWVLDVAEVENLMLEETIVRIIATHMQKDPNEVFNHVKHNLISFFSSRLESQILLHYKETLRRRFLRLTEFSSRDIDSAIAETDALFASVDKKVLYDSIKGLFEDVISTNNYENILRLFNLKKALIPNSKICELTGIINKEHYIKLVISLLKKNDNNSECIKDAIKRKIICNATV